MRRDGTAALAQDMDDEKETMAASGDSMLSRRCVRDAICRMMREPEDVAVCIALKKPEDSWPMLVQYKRRMERRGSKVGLYSLA